MRKDIKCIDLTGATASWSETVVWQAKAWIATLENCRYQLPTSSLRWPFVWQGELLRRIRKGAEDGDGQKGKGVSALIQGNWTQLVLDTMSN